MKIVQLTPGAGEMYCGNCFRDNALVTQWNHIGHQAIMVPLYLPLTLDEEDQSAKQPIFFGGVNVYLEQRLPWLWRFAPKILRNILDTRWLLKRIGKHAVGTQASQVGKLAVSMFRGENGRQRRDLQTLTDWLKTEQQPDVVLFSNALLLGMHRMIKKETGAKTVCFLSGEDGFLDAIKEPFRSEAWNLTKKNLNGVDLLIAPSRYYAEYISKRLEIEPGKIRVVPNGLRFDGYEDDTQTAKEFDAPTFGFFARMSFEKGLDKLITVYTELRKRNAVPGLKLIVGGNLNPWNEILVDIVKLRLRIDDLLAEASFHPNVSRTEKIRLLKSMDVFCVPTQGNEPFGYYVLEAIAAGVPVMLPNRAAFPEILATIGGGVLYEPNNQNQMIEMVEQLFLDENRRKELTATSREKVREHYSIERVAQIILDLISEKQD